MAQLFETLCMMLAFKESHSLAMHYCRLVWDVRSLSYLFEKTGLADELPQKGIIRHIILRIDVIEIFAEIQYAHGPCILGNLGADLFQQRNRMLLQHSQFVDQR